MSPLLAPCQPPSPPKKYFSEHYNQLIQYDGLLTESELTVIVVLFVP